MKERYILLMEKSLSAYTDAHILRYFNEVKTNGLTEHGFPRLTANIGILIFHMLDTFKLRGDFGKQSFITQSDHARTVIGRANHNLNVIRFAPVRP